MELNWLLGAGLLVLLLLYGFARWYWRGAKLTGRLRFSALSFMPRESGIKPKLVKLLPWIRAAALICFVIALMRPRVGLEKITTQTSGVVMEMLMDRSSSMGESMNFQGEEMTRLEAAITVFQHFLIGDQEGLNGRGADRIGLISFAGFVDEIAPLSMDHPTLAHLAGGISRAQREEDGTMIGDALHYATLRLMAAETYFEGVPIESKVIILLTDGQQTQGGATPMEAAQKAKEAGVKIYTVALAPESGFGGIGGLFNLMAPPLDTRLIEEAAQLTGGGFFKAGDGEELLEIYRQIDQLEKTKFSESFTLYEESFPLFIWPGLLLLLLELSLDWLYLRRR